MRFSPFDGNQIAVATSQYFGLAGGGTLFLLENVNNQLVEKQKFQWTDGLFDVVWSEFDPNIIVTTSGDGGLQIWNTGVATPIQTLNEHKNEVYSVDWTRTRQQQLLLSASWDHTIKVWDPTHKSSLNTFLGHSQLVYNAMWSPHIPHSFASVSGDGNLKLWSSLNNNSSITFRAHDAEVLSCDWCKYDQNIISTCGSDGLIRGWDIRNYTHPIFQLRGCDYAVRRIQFSPHAMSLLASVSYDYTTRIWDYKKSPEAVEVIKHHSEFVYGLDWNNLKAGELADCGWDSLLHVFTPLSVKNVLNII